MLTFTIIKAVQAFVWFNRVIPYILVQAGLEDIQLSSGELTQVFMNSFVNDRFVTLCDILKWTPTQTSQNTMSVLNTGLHF